MANKKKKVAVKKGADKKNSTKGKSIPSSKKNAKAQPTKATEIPVPKNTPKRPITENQHRYYKVMSAIRDVYRERGIKLKQREVTEIYKEALKYFGYETPLKRILENLDLFIAKREGKGRGEPPKQMYDFEWFMISDIFTDSRMTENYFIPNDTIEFDFSPLGGDVYQAQFDFVAETYSTNIYPEIRPITQQPPFVRGSPVPIMVYISQRREGATDIFTWKVDSGETARRAASAPAEIPKKEAEKSKAEKPKEEVPKEEKAKEKKPKEEKPSEDTKKTDAENRKAEIELEKIKAQNEGKKLDIELEKERRLREKQTESMIAKIEKQYKQGVWTKAEYKNLLKKLLK